MGLLYFVKNVRTDLVFGGIGTGGFHGVIASLEPLIKKSRVVLVQYQLRVLRREVAIRSDFSCVARSGGSSGELLNDIVPG